MTDEERGSKNNSNIERDEMDPTVDDISTSSQSTVPPPSRPHLGDRNPSEWPSNTRASSSTTTSLAGPSNRARLHRPSALSLTDQSSGASSARILLGTSLPSGNSMKRRKDNWQALRDMMEDEEENSDTETIRPDQRENDGGRNEARSSASIQSLRSLTSVQSLRSLFTPRSTENQGGGSRPWSIVRMPEDEASMSSGLLSSSPPQMNGFPNGIEETLDPIREDGTPKLKTKTMDRDTAGSPNVQNGREESQTLLHQATTVSIVDVKPKCQYRSPLPFFCLCVQELIPR